MFSTATPKWLLAAGLAGMVAAPASAQSLVRAADFAPAAAVSSDQAPNFKLSLGGGLVEDPSFEASMLPLSDRSNPFWDEFEPLLGGGGSPFCTDACFGDTAGRARTGDWFAIMGFVGSGTAFVEQDVTVDEAGDYDFTFYWRGGIFEAGDTDAQGALRGFVGDDLVYELTAADAPGGSGVYQEIRIPVSLAAGETSVRIELEYDQPEGSDVFQVILDDVSLAPPPPPTTSEELITVETDEASLGVYSDARIGTNANNGAFTGPGFVFGDAQADGTALFSSVFLAGVSGTRLSGTSYDADNDWVAEFDFEPIDAPAGFDTAFESVFNDSNAENPLGLRVAQRVYASSSTADVNAGVVLEYVILNNSDEEIEDLYAGIFADWDVGAFTNNLADFFDGDDVGLNYVYEAGGATNSAYYGVAALNQDVSGYAFDQENGNDTPAGELEVFDGLTTTADAPTEGGDRRTTTGVGPFDLEADDEVGVRFALVGGTDAADIQANAEAIAAATDGLAFASVPPPPPINTVYDNGVISFEAFGNGYFGAVAGDGAGFVFDGENGLYEGQFLVALSEDDVIGTPYTPGDYTVVEAIQFGDSVDGFDTVTEAVFASTDGAVEVTERVFVPEDGPYVVLRYTVQNVSGGTLDAVYLGPFVDYDVESFGSNVGGYIAANRLVYASNNTDDSDFFGVLSRTNSTGVSGWSTTVAPDSDAGLYAGLTTPGVQDEAPADRRLTIGNGPFNLVDGQSVTVTYALLAGETLQDLQNTAVLAQFVVLPTAIEDPTDETAAAEMGVRVFPNPAAGQATVAFRAPAGTDARVTVFDVLGREVLRVADQTATDAEQRVQFNTSALPAGVYLVRLTAGDVTDVQQITIVR